MIKQANICELSLVPTNSINIRKFEMIERVIQTDEGDLTSKVGYIGWSQFRNDESNHD